MSILTTWNNRDKSIILIEFESEWNWDDLNEAVASADDLIASVEHQVDFVLDLEGTSIPKDFMNAARSLLANPEPRPNEGVRVVVGVNGTLKAIYKSIQKAFKSKIDGRELLFAENVDDAKAIIRGIRMEQME